MAQLNRSPKSGNDWTYNELAAYNISITPTSPDDFFQHNPDPPLDNLDPTILTAPVMDRDDPSYSDAASEYLAYLDFATRVDLGDNHESTATNLATETLRLLKFRDWVTIITLRYPIPLVICGETQDFQPDVCVIHRPSMGFKTFLLMDRSIFGDGAASVGNIEAQVVAGAIAVYHSNNDARTAKGLPVVEAMTVPCISMEATKPTFYLVPVTKNLSNAVATGQYPASQTHVLQCATVAPPDRGQASNWAPARYGRVRDGMANPEYREIALRRFLAFRDVANRCFQEYMD